MGEAEDGFSVKEQDLLLPSANIQRLMKSVLPANSKLSEEAKISMQDCVSEFILFITQEAAENAVNSNKKTISGDGIVPAFTLLGLRNYALVLSAFLGRYRELGQKLPQRKGEAGEDEAAGKGGIIDDNKFDGVSNRPMNGVANMMYPEHHDIQLDNAANPVDPDDQPMNGVSNQSMYGQAND